MYRWVPCKEINWRRRNSEVGKTSIYWETKSLWRCFSWRNATLYHTWINRKYSTYFFSFDKKYSFFLCLYKGISFSEPIVGSRSSQSLDDITLDEDTDSEKQLQDFLEAEETVCINCTVDIYIQYTNVCIFAIQISTSKTPITLGFCQGFPQPVSANLTLYIYIYKYCTCTWLVYFIGYYWWKFGESVEGCTWRQTRWKPC